MEPSDSPSGAGGQSRAEEETAARPHLLVVEDHNETQLFLKIALEEHYRVDTARNAGEALRQAGDARYDAVLLDIALGSAESGLDVLKALRESDRYAETPIIAVTAYALDEDRRRFLEAGFDAYLKKPFFQNDLLEVVERELADEQAESPEAG